MLLRNRISIISLMRWCHLRGSVCKMVWNRFLDALEFQSWRNVLLFGLLKRFKLWFSPVYEDWLIQLEFNFGNLVVLFSVWITSQSWRFKLFRIWANCIQSFLLSNLNIIIEIQVHRILWDLTQPQLSMVHDSIRGYLSIPWLFIDGRLIIVQELQKLTIFLGFLSKVVFLCTISFEWLLVLQQHTCCPSYFFLASLKFIRSWLSL